MRQRWIRSVEFDMIELAKTPCTKHSILVDASKMRKMIDEIHAFFEGVKMSITVINEE